MGVFLRKDGVLLNVVMAPHLTHIYGRLLNRPICLQKWCTKCVHVDESLFVYKICACDAHAHLAVGTLVPTRVPITHRHPTHVLDIIGVANWCICGTLIQKRISAKCSCVTLSCDGHYVDVVTFRPPQFSDLHLDDVVQVSDCTVNCSNVYNVIFKLLMNDRSQISKVAASMPTSTSGVVAGSL